MGSDAGTDVDHETGITDMPRLRFVQGSSRFVADGLTTLTRELEQAGRAVFSPDCCTPPEHTAGEPDKDYSEHIGMGACSVAHHGLFDGERGVDDAHPLAAPRFGNRLAAHVAALDVRGSSLGRLGRVVGW